VVVTSEFFDKDGKTTKIKGTKEAPVVKRIYNIELDRLIDGYTT